MQMRNVLFAAVCTSMVSFGAVASAAEPAGPAPAAAASEGGEGGMRLPVSFVERGITNPALILSPVLEFSVAHIDVASGGILTVGSSTIAGLTLGAGFSITDDFGVRATVLALQLNSPFQYTGPTVGATYRFVKGEFELGAAVDVTIATPSGGSAGVAVSPSVPMRVHFGKTARLDVTPTVPIATGGGLKSAVVGLGVPVLFAVDITEPLHVGATTGFLISDFNDAGHNIGVPLGVIAGYAVGGAKGPVLDIDPFFRWPALFTPGAPTGVDAVHAGDFEVGLELTGYLYL